MAPKNALPVIAQVALNGWIPAAAPVVEKIYGTSDASWAQARSDYMSGFDHLFPAPEGVSYGTVMMDYVPSRSISPTASFFFS